MIGSPRHVQKCLDAGVDILCAQGTEGGGHTGDISTTVLIPMIVDLVKGKTSKMHGGPIYVVAAGGIVDSRGLNMALGFGASAVWVGTRFICAEEADASPAHQKAVLTADAESTTRTLIYSGRHHFVSSVTLTLMISMKIVPTKSRNCATKVSYPASGMQSECVRKELLIW